MQRKPGFPVTNSSIKMPENLLVDSADEDSEQQNRRQQLINFGHAQWGFNNWNWAVTKQELDFVDITIGKYCAGVVAFVSVSVKNIDINRENIGYATALANSKGIAIYKSRKVAVTNALRETLLSFGGSVATGLTELLETTRDCPIEPLKENNLNIANTNLPSNLSNKNLANTNLPSNKLPSTNLPSANLPSTNLPSTSLPSTNLPSTNLPSTNLPSTNLPSNPANINHVNASHGNANHANASHANASHANANHANVSHANVSHANVSHANANHGNTNPTITSNLAKSLLEGPSLVKNLRKNSIDSGPANPPPIKNVAPVAKAHPMPVPTLVAPNPRPRPALPVPPAHQVPLAHRVTPVHQVPQIHQVPPVHQVPQIHPVHPRPNSNEPAKFEGMTEEEARVERKRRQRLAQKEFREKQLVKQGPLDEKQDKDASSLDKLLLEIPTQDIVIEETGASKRKSPTPEICAKRRASVSRLDILHD